MLKIILRSFLLLLFLSSSASALDYVPEVYSDEYVNIRAGVMESGNRPIHLGDLLTLSVEVDFSSDEVLVENLSEEIFRRNWGSEKALVLISPPEVSLSSQAGGMSTLRGLYRFEVLDCPGDMISCAGHKVYPLPVISMGYQIIDVSGAVVNNKSVRFNAWPGTLTVTQVLPVHHEGLAEFSTYFPDGAFSGSLPYTEQYTGGLWTALAGGLLILASFAPTLLPGNAPRRVETVARRSGRRWESVLALLQDDKRAFTDEEWSDLIRRCAVWYCLDEHAFNPYNWLSLPESGQAPSLQSFREFFTEVLNEESIDKDRRAGFILRFRQLARLNGNAAQHGVAA